MNDLELLARDKYEGDVSLVTDEDKERLVAGEPLAYVIGWVPFLHLHVDLSSRPLIPRPETEWWTNELITHLKNRFGSSPFRFLDLCAGSGAIGLSVLKAFPRAHISFGELVPKHCEQIQKNLTLNGLDATRTDVRTSDLFSAFDGLPAESWDVIATNPPYIPTTRTHELDTSVKKYEPHEALFSGTGGLDLIRRISSETPKHLRASGELWMECDIANIEEAQALVTPHTERTAIRTDQYGRPRVLVSYFL